MMEDKKYLKDKIYSNNIEDMIIPFIKTHIQDKKIIILNVEMIGNTPFEQILRTRKTIQEKIIQQYGSFKYTEKIGILFQTKVNIKIEKNFTSTQFLITTINDIEVSVEKYLEEANNYLNNQASHGFINPKMQDDRLNHMINIKLSPKKKINNIVKQIPKEDNMNKSKKYLKKNIYSNNIEMDKLTKNELLEIINKINNKNVKLNTEISKLKTIIVMNDDIDNARIQKKNKKT